MDDNNCMRMLVDTGATTNSGHLDYHLWVMSLCPELIAKFLQCREDTEYDVVQLIITLDLELESRPSTHGQMKAVIRYHTPFYEQQRSFDHIVCTLQ